MKKLLLISLMIILSYLPLRAEKASEVMLRTNRQDDIIRIVLESDDDMIKNANTIASLSSVRIEFPAEFELKKQKEFMFDIHKKDRIVTMALKEIINVRTYKLSSPARLVIDLQTALQPQKEQAKTGQEAQKSPEQKSAKDPGRQTDPKVRQWSTGRSGWTTLSPGPKVQEAGQLTEKPSRPKIIMLDAGHGGYDYGIVSKDIREKDMTLNLLKDLGLSLPKKGHKVFFTRKTDQAVSLTERINFANSKKPDVLISIHASSSNSFVIYTSSPDDMNVDATVRLYSLSSRQSRHVEKSRAAA
ncbi:MAG: N-acetylmuramoyl-L-alanine amidase, partial [Nitrospirae bacterium]|nr:N-acetylmuramoyl-L-alanine amidase [Nitrospirota bacterium]